MGGYNMQDILKEIEEVAALVQNSEDINSVLDIFHRFIHFYTMLHIDGTMNTFSDEKDDISFELADLGVIKGRDQLRKHFSYMPKLAKKPGIFLHHYTTCPVVEIAVDGLTAKLTCFAPGADAIAEALMQNWKYGKYYADFIKQKDMQWRIWHLRWFRTFETPLMVGWLECQEVTKKEQSHPAVKDAYEERADALPGNYPEDWAYPKWYSPDKPNYLMPEPVKPYEKWDGITAMDFTRKY
jgi:hypothetical protein